ncbi:GerAB/ArcD/ProY family transporter [Clostridium hydrogeniformans]|uniref:GerAB/ArcD/ProY family transporter n=1 Tax=Clostridium hydrogeniformans TaxID=349933 RepID=UPI000691133C|nr:endospore germination permease [Clostridium hydrogeniformans]
MKETIKPFGLFASIVVTIIGVGLFSYPRELAEKVETNGWIITLVAGFFSCILMYIMYKVLILNNYESITNIIFNNLGKVVGYIVILIFNLELVMAIGTQGRSFVEVIKKYLLEKTPTELILIVTILTASYFISFGRVNIVKFNEIAFWIMFIPMVFILLIIMKEGDFTNVLPIGQVKISNYFSSLFSTLVAFGGFEIIFLFAPIVSDRNKVLKSSVGSMIFTSIFYTVIVIFSLALFTKHEVKNLLWPTITMVNTIDIPGTFVERWEGVIMTLWILFNFSTISNLMFFSSTLLKESFNLQKEVVATTILIPIIYGICLYPENFTDIAMMSEKILRPTVIFMIVILPITLLIVTKYKLRKKGGVKN